MLAIKIHESIQEGFSMTKIENTEILLTTKTILKSSDRFGYVKFYVDIRYYTDPISITMISDVLINLELIIFQKRASVLFIL